MSYVAWVQKLADLVNGSLESAGPTSLTAKLQRLYWRCYNLEHDQGPYLYAGVHSILSLSYHEVGLSEQQPYGFAAALFAGYGCCVCSRTLDGSVRPCC